MIEGKQIDLRLFQEDELETWVERGNRIREIGDFWPMMLLTKQSFKEAFEKEGLWGADRGVLAIVDKENELLGSIGYFKTIKYVEGFELGGRILKPEDRRKGYMTEAARLFTAFLMDSKPISRLYLSHFAGNEGTKAVALRCGFHFDGIMRKAVFDRGRLIDLHFYSLLREECPHLAEVLSELEA